jgi:hypothetical protein
MQHESPAPTPERDNLVGVGVSGASHPPGPAQRVRRRPLRLIHLIVMVATVAVALTLTPFLMKVIEQPFAGWDWDERLYHQISLTLTFWTPILALIAAIGNRYRVRRASRSYGTSAVFAAAAAIILLLVKGVIEAIPGFPGGAPIIASSLSHFSPAARRLVNEAPEGASAAIVAVWSVLALTGAGRRPSDWFDRICFLLGLLWVLWFLGGDYTILLHWL